MTTVLIDTITPQSQALAAIEKTIADVKTAFVDAPDSIEGNLPCFINIPGKSNTVWNKSETPGADGLDYIEGDETRAWTLYLFVMERGSGISGEIVNRCKPFLDGRVMTAFQGNQSLNHTRGVLGVELKGDAGISFGSLRWGLLTYAGLTFNLTITTRVIAQVAAHE